MSWYEQPDDTLLDDSGLTRAQKRAALYEMQDGKCAVCGAPEPPMADHDHATGILRGLLCRLCNTREGHVRSRLLDVADPAIEAYLAKPPAAGLGWMWDEPVPAVDRAAVIAMGRSRPRFDENTGRG